MATLTWRNRAVTVTCVCAFLVITRMLVEDPRLRAERQYLFVITLGYGHLIGAAVFARQRIADLVPGRWSHRLGGVAVGLGVLDLFVVYAWATHVSLAVFLPLLVVSIWHIVENDLALRRAYTAPMGLGPVPRWGEHQLAALAGAALLASVAQQLLSPVAGDALLGGGRGAASGGWLLRVAALASAVWLAVRSRAGYRAFGAGVAAATAIFWSVPGLLSNVRFGDFFSALTLYHLVQFLVFFADRIARLPDRAARRARIQTLAWVHVPASLLCASLLLLPGDELAALRYAVFSPVIYLFWSVLHVVHTVTGRGVARVRAHGPPTADVC
jgi:hypothetical protein